MRTITNRLNARKQSPLFRSRAAVNFSKPSALIHFSSNDYLGLSHHPRIVESFSLAAKQYGFGSGGSTFICGYSDVQAQLEFEFARWLNVDRAIFFNSGYLANIGVLQALCNHHDIIFSDKLSHASLLDSIQLTRAKHIRYAHCNVDHIKTLVKNNVPTFLVSESVFSMDGDIAPIKNIVNIAEQHQTGLLIDDAHGIGWLGETGRGIIEHAALTQQDFFALVLPLGKAFYGVGAIVAGRDDIIESILQFSKTCCYTTALPPAICAALLTVLEIIQTEKFRREKLLHNILFFNEYANQKKIKCVSSDLTPIRSVIIGDNKQARSVCEKLLGQGFCVNAILPPTVPQGTARLRVSLNANHGEFEISSLIDAIATAVCARPNGTSF